MKHIPLVNISSFLFWSVQVTETEDIFNDNHVTLAIIQHGQQICHFHLGNILQDTKCYLFE